MGFNTEALTYPSANGTDTIFAKLFLPTDTDIRAIVQISHGMCEYFDRYRPFAEFLCSKGFMVCGNDHIGHHHSASSPAALGYFSKENGWHSLVQDVYALTLLMKERFPATPYFLLGHSMGSFVVRCCMEQYGSELSGAIVSGTGGPNPMAAAGEQLAALLCRTQGPQKRNKLLEDLIFGKYNDHFEHRTKKDWLSRNHQVVDAYLADPACNFRFTNSAFRDLIAMMQHVNAADWAKRLPQDLPILLFSGTEDPVGNYGKGVRYVYQQMKAAGIFDVTLQLYPGGRHEMLNEINCAEVFNDVYDWIARKI